MSGWEVDELNSRTAPLQERQGCGTRKNKTKGWPTCLSAGFVAAALVCLWSCSSLCEESPGGQARSPDAMLDAVTTYRDCGATTAEYTHVTLQPSAANHNDIKQVIFTVRNRH